MNNIDLFYDEKDAKYYFTGIAICEHCSKIIEHTVLIYNDTARRTTSYYCFNCMKRIKRGIAHSQLKMAILVDTPGRNCRPILNSGFELSIRQSSSGEIVSVFAVANEREFGVTIIDNTIQSHNPYFMIQHDAKTQEQIESGLKERLISYQHLDAELNEIKNSKALISRFENQEEIETEERRMLK